MAYVPQTTAGDALLEALLRFEADIPSMEGYRRSVFKNITRLKDSMRAPRNRVSLGRVNQDGN